MICFLYQRLLPVLLQLHSSNDALNNERILPKIVHTERMELDTSQKELQFDHDLPRKFQNPDMCPNFLVVLNQEVSHENSCA